MRHLVISFITNDRPGIVEKLSAVIKTHQGNWQTSSLHHLSGLFAGIIEITVAETNVEALSTALGQIEHLEVQLKLAPEQSVKPSKQVVLEFTANDRVGIVQEISAVIHHQHGNLIKLVSRQQSAPHSGQLMFKAKAHIAIDQNLLDNLISALENIADDLMIDIKTA